MKQDEAQILNTLEPLILAASLARVSQGFSYPIIALRQYSRWSARGIASAIQRGQLRPRPAPAIGQSTSALLRFSGFGALDNPGSFLEAKPHEWATFSEPQITRGWAHFLEDRHRLARCQAFVAAAFQTDPSQFDTDPCVAIELIAPEVGRIDLLLIARLASGVRVAVCIEAKFGHVLTDGQLEKYERALENIHKIPERSRRCLLILGSRHRRDIAKQLATPGNEWHFLTWARWLIRFENKLPPAIDDDEFRKFRRTTLARANHDNDLS